MSTDPQEASLKAVLGEQIRCAEAMLETLTRESAALAGGDHDALETATAAKTKLVDTLEKLEARRREMAQRDDGAGTGEWQHLKVEVEHPAGEALEDVEDPLVAFGMVSTPDHGARRYGAGVDHRVERAVVALVEGDGIERLAGGFDADMAQHFLASVILERQGIYHCLRDGLDSEKRAGIANFIDKPVGSCEG
jgi:hypothetical protein